MSDSGVTIARAAEAACVGVETVRYYQRRGLVAQPAQRPGSYRRYDSNHVARIRFIKRAQGLGFSLQEIQGLLALQDGTDRAKVRQIALARLSAIRTRLEDLRRMEATLAHLLEHCREGRSVECPIIEALVASDEARQATAPRAPRPPLRSGRASKRPAVRRARRAASS